MTGSKIVIVDYGVGNLYSVQRALEVCGASDICISSDPTEVLIADRVILPGVGAFADGILGLRERGLDVAIREFANSKRPLLGICLGMQIFATMSEEFGEHTGLGLIPGMVRAIPSVDIIGFPLKIPFVGWSSLDRPDRVHWKGTVLGQMTSEQSVYLVHSFHFVPVSQSNLLATYQYGGHNITAAIVKENIIGLQFHPEKSGEVGLSVLSKFLQY